MSNYNELSEELEQLRRDYMLEYRGEKRPDILQELFDKVLNLDQQIKQIDKSLGSWSDGGNGTYKKQI